MRQLGARTHEALGPSEVLEIKVKSDHVQMEHLVAEYTFRREGDLGI